MAEEERTQDGFLNIRCERELLKACKEMARSRGMKTSEWIRSTLRTACSLASGPKLNVDSGQKSSPEKKSRGMY